MCVSQLLCTASSNCVNVCVRESVCRSCCVLSRRMGSMGPSASSPHLTHSLTRARAHIHTHTYSLSLLGRCCVRSRRADPTALSASFLPRPAGIRRWALLPRQTRVKQWPNTSQLTGHTWWDPTAACPSLVKHGYIIRQTKRSNKIEPSARHEIDGVYHPLVKHRSSTSPKPVKHC